LGRRLVSMGYTVVSVINTASAVVSVRSTAAQPVVQVDGVPPSLEPRIPIRLLATYLRQMASLIRSGLTPYQATAEIKSRTHNRRLRHALEDMEAQVQAGGHLAPVLTAHPDVFPTKVVGLIYCGELGGYMDRALDEAATDIEQEASARLLPRLVYGFVRLNVVLTILMIPVSKLGAWMTQMMNPNAGNSLGLLGKIYMQAFWHTVLPMLAIYVVACYSWPHIKRVPAVRAWLDSVIVKTPIWGNLHASRALGRFGKSLAQLYSAGIAPDRRGRRRVPPARITISPTACARQAARLAQAAR
jgi:type IV pilus assembly protein PilC